MNALQFFLLRYHAVHGGFVDDLFAGLTDEQARARPHGLNSIAWLVWHATRVEDAAVNRFVADRPQVLAYVALQRQYADGELLAAHAVSRLLAALTSRARRAGGRPARRRR